MKKEILEAYKADLEEQLVLVKAMLKRFDKLGGGTPVGPPRSVSDLKDSASHSNLIQMFTQPRIRGVLSSVREILPELPDPFDKNDIMARLRVSDSVFARSVTAANLRNTLRILVKNGEIKVEIEPTSRSCGKYSLRRAAELNEALLVNE